MMIDKKMESLDLIDLISARHDSIRLMLENITSEKMPEASFRDSEWYLIDKINYGMPTFAELSKIINLTRQAIHKTVKHLEQKGVVKIEAVANNKKEKCVLLTDFGIQCFEKYISYKFQVVAHIEKVIGNENFDILKKMLQQNWDLDQFETDI